MYKFQLIKTTQGGMERFLARNLPGTKNKDVFDRQKGLPGTANVMAKETPFCARHLFYISKRQTPSNSESLPTPQNCKTVMK